MFAVIANPIAGGGRAKGRAETVFAKLQALGIPCEICYTKECGHATMLVNAFYQKGYRQFISVGGDGTHREVAAGIMALNDETITLGIIPAGTGNDFCRNLRIPVHPLKSLAVVLKGNIKKVDGISFKTEEKEVGYCINEAGMGFDVALLQKTQPLKKFFKGLIVYLLALFPVLFSYRSQEMTITLDGKVIFKKALLVAVSNGKYFGGGMKVAPEAEVCDGLLDVCVIDDLPRLKILLLLMKFIRGKHGNFKEAHFFRCREVKIETQEPFKVQADGDIVAKTPVVLRVVPGALQVYAPE